MTNSIEKADRAMKRRDIFERLAKKADERMTPVLSEAIDEIASRDAEIDFLQSRIDELMLEYCPNYMTQEQIDNWAAHQRPVGESELPETIRIRSTK